MDAKNRGMAGKARGVRVFAETAFPSGAPTLAKPLARERGFIFWGLGGMMDPPRKEAKEAVSLSRKAGVKTVMITGDHKLTACAVAREMGIWHEGDRVLAGGELSALTEEQEFRDI